MHKVSDYIHPLPGQGRCRIRVYLPEDEHDSPVVLATEFENNPGQSITNYAERLAAEVMEGHHLSGPVVWIEHYEEGARGTEEDPASFDLVMFSSYEVTESHAPYLGDRGLRIGEPAWKPLDRRAVEMLVKEKV